MFKSLLVVGILSLLVSGCVRNSLGTWDDPFHVKTGETVYITIHNPDGTKEKYPVKN